MKVLHINDYYELIGGTETYLFALLDVLKERDIETVIVHEIPSQVKGRGRAYEIPGLTTFNFRSSRSEVVRLTEILRDEKPDLIHLHSVDNPYVTETCSTFAPTIRSIHNHNNYCPGGGKYFPAIGKICEKPFGTLCIPFGIITHCTSRRPGILFRSYFRTGSMLRTNHTLQALLVASQYVRDRMVQNGFPKEVVRVLPYFTDLPADLGLCPDSNTILFTGRVAPQKGLNILLRSLKYVQSPFHLIVDGDGLDMGRVRKLTCELGLEDQVEFVGWAPQEKHLAYYRQASVVVVPSIWPEPFGMVGIEAMSFGKPVVAFRVGGIPEWLEDGVTGFLIKPYDVKEMAEKVSYLIEHPGIANEMGMRGRKRVEQEFNQEKHISTLLEIYREVIDEKARS